MWCVMWVSTLALFLQAGENAGGGVSHWRSMRPTLLAAHLLLREVLHILQAAHRSCNSRCSGGRGVQGSGCWVRQKRAIKAASLLSVLMRRSSLSPQRRDEACSLLEERTHGVHPIVQPEERTHGGYIRLSCWRNPPMVDTSDCPESPRAVPMI